MKITPKILSIPPYVSTTWKNISSIHMKEHGKLFTLVITLQDQVQIEIPGLDRGTVDTVFEAHAKYAEGETPQILNNPYTFTLPLKGDGGGMMDFFHTSMQHNPEQSHLDPLPPAVLNKIASIAKAFGLEESALLPPSEPNCNCMYCQIARVLHPESGEEESVSDEDLQFKNWEIEQTADKLYKVTNPLDSNEHYNVFLGEPLGCTCGHKNCEHIRAVLSS